MAHSATLGTGLGPDSQHQFLLHDGRDRGFAEAILWRGGEGEAAKQALRNLPKADRDNLAAFLNAL